MSRVVWPPPPFGRRSAGWFGRDPPGAFGQEAASGCSVSRAGAFPGAATLRSRKPGGWEPQLVGTTGPLPGQRGPPPRAPGERLRQREFSPHCGVEILPAGTPPPLSFLQLHSHQPTGAPQFLTSNKSASLGLGLPVPVVLPLSSLQPRRARGTPASIRPSVRACPPRPLLPPRLLPLPFPPPQGHPRGLVPSSATLRD